MFQKIFIALFLISAASCPTYGQGKSDREEGGFFGPVKTVRTEIVEISYFKGVANRRDRKIESVEEFDRHGWTLAKSEFIDGVLFDRIQNSYDSAGRLKESIEFSTDHLSPPKRTAYTYDLNGLLFEEIEFNSTGQSGSIIQHIYDERSREVQEDFVWHYLNGTEKHERWTYAYDEKGRLRDHKTFVLEGDTYKPAEEFFDSYETLYIYEISEHPRYQLLFHADGRLTEFAALRYDRRGNEIEDIKYSTDGTIKEKLKYSYVFDKHGNWIRGCTFKWTKEDPTYRLTEIEYQVFHYFPQ